MTSTPMPSVFAVPDLKKTTSFRLPESLRLKIEVIREDWKLIAESQGASKEEINSIDNTYVMVTLLGRQADEELQQFGGFPATEEQKAAHVKKLRESIRAQKSSK